MNAPSTLKIELTEGCNLRCGMCGIQGIRVKAPGPYLYMTPSVAEQVGRLVSIWRPKVEFAMRGEPLMNPEAETIISIFRRYLPKSQLMLTTNGIPMLPDPKASAMALFDAGLNILAVDCYQPSKKVEALLRASFPWPSVMTFDYPSNDSPYHNHSYKEHRLFLIEDFETAALASKKIGTKVVSNHTGAGGPTVPTQNRTCARPFREFTIRYDGQVHLCCNDWRGVYKIGDLRTESDIERVWQGEALQAARRILQSKSRAFKPCDGCNNVSYYTHMLPKMPAPTAQDLIVAERASAGEPLTTPVLRHWEKSPIP